MAVNEGLLHQTKFTAFNPLIHPDSESRITAEAILKKAIMTVDGNTLPQIQLPFLALFNFL